MKDTSTSFSKTGSLLAVIAGFGVGTGLSLLFAPRSGRDLRNALAGNLHDSVSRMRTGVSATRDAVLEGVSAAKEAYRARTGHAEPPITGFGSIF